MSESEQGDRTAGACVGCAKPLEGPRCGWCGVAAAPGGYRIERVVAEGPFSRVYLARDARGEALALKEIQFAAVPDAQRLDAFEREGKTLAELHHPGIPRFIGTFVEGAGVSLRLYLASEFIFGESLASGIARGALPEDEVVAIARKVLGVLRYLHGRTPAVLHRDIKPQNLMIRPDGSLVVVDFGSARRVGGNRTFGSTLVGTFGYMPPEQLGGTVDPTSDLYALGATLLHAVTGQEPWQLLGPDLALRIPARTSPRLRALLTGMLQLQPERRFPSADVALDVLEGRRSAQPHGPRSSRRVALALLLGSSALALGLSFRGNGTPSTAHPAAASTLALRYGSEPAKQWFVATKPSCNALEVAQHMARRPPPAGWDGAGYAAACYALAGKISEARRLIAGASAGYQAQAAAIIFEVGHPVADSGDDVSASAIMKLVLEFWPENYQALYHAGMSDYALGRHESASAQLERFVGMYHADDGFRRNALHALARIAQGLPSEAAKPGAHE